MSRSKQKLVLKTTIIPDEFVIVKSINTLEFGVPGKSVSRKEVDRIFIDHKTRIARGDLTVEFIQ